MPVLIENVNYLEEQGIFIERGFVAWDDQKIIYVGREYPSTVKTDGWEIIDGRGKWLMPGMIDAHCHIGLFDDGLTQEGDDGNEDTDPVTPHMRGIDGVFHEDRCFSEALAAGITSANTGPGSANVLSGSFALVRTA
ncbi:MAG: hypothetical protein PWP10_3025, partial [Clostridiales bacterium]|nr:hypothetical protein [Clostridiales bacterium]